MAENLNTESPAAGHNIGDVTKIIRECAAAMNDIDNKRAELNEEAGDIRTRLKDAGVQTKAFDYARRLYKMEQEARGSYMDDLRLSMEALGMGEQGDFFQSADEAAA